ncbi:MAG: hypothetical protein HC845_09840 [Akkermansiaceae bacterium]|nr:hypothetical protein [Akkermansiaceae bacterium]
MNIPRIISLLSLWLVASCANNSEKISSTPERKSLQQRLDENHGYKQDADGNWKAQSDRRSSFESQGEASQFRKAFNKKEYKKGEYAKKSWWGNKDYDRKSYSGNTDGSRFQKTASQQGQSAREALDSYETNNYDTDAYATNAAREARSAQIGKPNNAEIENRRKVFNQPDIIDYRERRSLTIEQSKSILGR